MGCIYKATNTVNGKAYIGQTIHSLAWRKMRHNDQVTRGDQTPLHRAFRKYGKQAFKWECIIEGIEDRDQLDKLEAEYIFWHDTMAPRGYNLQTGGKGCRHSEETIQKMKEAHKGRHTEPNNVHTISQLIQWARVKQEHGNIKACTPRESKRMANGCPSRDRASHLVKKIRAKERFNRYKRKLYTENETIRERLRIKCNERRIKYRAVVAPIDQRIPCLCITDGIRYESINAAALAYGLYHTDVSKVCKGKQITVHGKMFKYI
jgi:group I intron endonuclease